MTSSVTVFVLTSIVFFTVGFLCGHFCQNKRKTAGNVSHKKTQRTPYYNDVVLQQHQQELDLKENVVYGPIQYYSTSTY